MKLTIYKSTYDQRHHILNINMQILKGKGNCWTVKRNFFISLKYYFNSKKSRKNFQNHNHCIVYISKIHVFNFMGLTIVMSEETKTQIKR